MEIDGNPLEKLEPSLVWQAFDALRRVPRPPRHAERVSAHVAAWAAEHGFELRRDGYGNLVVAAAATPGREKAPGVVIQAHLDMVCVRDAGSAHDFERDPIEVEVAGDWLRARGTTLGADNGLGVAMAMAAASDAEVEHGPLELLFTLDEEIGLLGARAFDPSLVGGRYLLNLDTEEEGAVYVGCAGAGGLEARLPLGRGELGGAPRREPLRLAVDGLGGGHSGVDILENRGNALRILARALDAALEAGVDLRLVSLEGGGPGNAIPARASAELLVAAGARPALEAAVAEVREALAGELGSTDAGLRLELLPPAVGRPAWGPLDAGCQARLVALLNALPAGVLAMSREVPGLVETSSNLAAVETAESAAVITCSCRSSVAAALAGTLASLRSIARLAGAEVEVREGYPGWRPRPDSALVRRAAVVHEAVFGRPPEVKAIHAGLECGVLLDALPGLEAVSFGPEIRGAHSPSERVRISSVGRCYRWLGALLADLVK